jgi:hypothetical protein
MLLFKLYHINTYYTIKLHGIEKYELGKVTCENNKFGLNTKHTKCGRINFGLHNVEKFKSFRRR